MAKDNGSGFVTVACKLPMGFYLAIYDMVDFDETTPSGFRTVKKAVKRMLPGCEQHDGRYYINGTNTVQDDYEGRSVVFGYALTRKVPCEVWNKWEIDNKDSDMLKNRIVFAYPDDGKTMDRAKEEQKSKVKSGFEPLRIGSDRNVDDPRIRSIMNRGMRITTADEQITKPRVRRDEE